MGAPKKADWREERRNRTWKLKDELYRKLIQAKVRVRHKQEIIKSCTRQCGDLV